MVEESHRLENFTRRQSTRKTQLLHSRTPIRNILLGFGLDKEQPEVDATLRAVRAKGRNTKINYLASSALQPHMCDGFNELPIRGRAGQNTTGELLYGIASAGTG